MPSLTDAVAEYVERQIGDPFDEWTMAFAENKWQGHIFCPPDPATRNLVFEAAVQVFRDACGV